MERKCNNCAKFLTCNKQKCKKMTFVEAGILDKPTREWYETIKGEKENEKQTNRFK